MSGKNTYIPSRKNKTERKINDLMHTYLFRPTVAKVVIPLSAISFSSGIFSKQLSQYYSL